MIAELARELGFHRAAVVPIEAPRRHELYASWLASGLAGEMTYLAREDHVQPRADLRRLLATARSLVVVALAYDRADPIVAGGAGGEIVSSEAAAGGIIPASRLRGRIAKYARGEDYHLVMRDKLVALADRIAQRLGRAVASRPCVDSAPILEREWAERGGLGFVAKNTMVIAPGLGSYVVLGELLVDADLEITAPETPPKPRCGSCRACLDACPTNAFPDAYLLDARRCISYLTIEHHGVLPRELRPLIGTWIFGCDVCQDVCPFNAGAGEPPDPLLTPRTGEHALPDLVALARITTNQLRQLVRRTAMRRVPRHVLLRNVAVALGNTGSPDAIAPLVELAADRAPLVRGHAIWALGQLGAGAALAMIDVPGTADDSDDDAFIRDELSAARETACSSRTPPPT